MRRKVVVVVVAGMLTGIAGSAAGCARSAAGTAVTSSPVSVAPVGDRPAGATEAEVYAAVLRRYLGTPAENSFPARTFKTVYVLDQAHPDAGDPRGKHERGTLLAPSIQQQVTASLAAVAQVTFIDDRNAVTETKDGCAQVKDGGILITLGTVTGDGQQAQVPISGFVACLGATWLTYVVQNRPGTGWRVTGTTGPSAIS
ncbi:hypothetical protein ACIBPB_25185 [Micromonospora sp. NPDC049836]|uniref:hypothetical protein n=1 Tax=Micromonospora sp. NPDC049836 TaxID=3364274 RepID=UPI00379450E2